MQQVNIRCEIGRVDCSVIEITKGTAKGKTDGVFEVKNR